MGFSKQGYWSGLPCPPPGDLTDPGIEPGSPESPALQADSLPLSHWGSHLHYYHPNLSDFHLLPATTVVFSLISRHPPFTTIDSILNSTAEVVFIKLKTRTSLVIQWFSVHSSVAGGTDLIPGWENKVPHAVWRGQINK